MTDLLEATQAALVVVAITLGPVDAVGDLLTHASGLVVTDAIWADLEAPS